ncbi:MAG TPA: DoxX family protein [Candidatus Dormibacteraeota bacterium]|nr:DoxX family protein [Candidatus Dormibacteraeota bacterium]
MLQLQKLYAWFARTAAYLQSPFLLCVRLYWGFQIAQNGWGKLHNLAKVTEFFTSLNIPAPGPTATFVATFEFVGGILLFIGLGSRLVGLMLATDMIVAYITADREAFVSFFQDPDKFAAAAPFVFLLAALIILIFGPGLFSVDTLLERRIIKAEKPAV